MEKKQIKKGEKRYCAYNPTTGTVWTLYDSVEEAQRCMDARFTIILEMEITKVLQINPILTEL